VLALWPWNKEYYITDKDYAHTKSGVDVERMASFAHSRQTVISALFGAVWLILRPRFRSLPAENVIRYPEKTVMEYSIIGHLHIMLALIGI